MLFLAMLSLVLGLIFLVLFGRRAIQSIRKRDDVRFAWIFVGLLFVVAALLPQSMLGTSDPGSRLILACVAVALFLTSSESGRMVQVAAVLSLILCLANLWQFSKVEAKPSATVVQDSLSPEFANMLMSRLRQG